MRPIVQRLKSRKFLVMFAAAMAPLISELVGIELSTEDVAAIVIPAVGWILGESWIDARHANPENGPKDVAEPPDHR